MRPSTLLSTQREFIRAAAERRNVTNPRVFGSTSRETDTPESDLDILVEPNATTTLFDLGGLQMDLEEALGISVDVVTPDDLPQAFRARVLAEAKPV